MRPGHVPRSIAEVFDPVVVAPERELLVTRSGRWSYAAIDRLANRAAHVLAGLGVTPGDRVAARVPRCPRRTSGPTVPPTWRSTRCPSASCSSRRSTGTRWARCSVGSSQPSTGADGPPVDRAHSPPTARSSVAPQLTDDPPRRALAHQTDTPRAEPAGPRGAPGRARAQQSSLPVGKPSHPRPIAKGSRTLAKTSGRSGRPRCDPARWDAIT